MKIKNLIYISLIMLGLSSYVDDKYNMENLDSTMELDTDLVGPLAYSKLNIVDVLNTESLGEFEIKINGDADTVAINCNNENLTITYDYFIFENKVNYSYEPLYFKYFANNNTWRLLPNESALDGSVVNLYDYGIYIRETPNDGDTLSTYNINDQNTVTVTTINTPIEK